MTRRTRSILTFGVVAGTMVLVPSNAALADDDSQAMAQHMRLMAEGNRGMAQMMDTPACMNMMNAPPFGGESPHSP